MTPTERSARISGALLVAAGAIGFSGKAVIIKLAYRHGVDAVTLLALRMVLSAPLFAVLGWWAARGADPVAPRDRWTVALMGFVGYYLASYFDFLGLQYVTAALFGRRVTGRDVIAIASCYAGIFLVFFNDLHTQPGNVVLGSAWVLLSALLYATYLVGSGRLVGRVGSMRFASYAGLVSCGAVVAHFLVASPDASVILRQPAPVYWLSVLMAVASTVLPIVLTSEGIRRMGASHASIIGSVGPIATIALGAAFLGEPITIIQVAGAAFVLLGVLTISLARK